MTNTDLDELVKLAKNVQGSLSLAHAYLVGMMSAHLCDCAMESIKESLERQILEAAK